MREYGGFLMTALAERKIDLDLSKLASFYGQLEVRPAMVDTVRRLRTDSAATALSSAFSAVPGKRSAMWPSAATPTSSSFARTLQK